MQLRCSVFLSLAQKKRLRHYYNKNHFIYFALVFAPYSVAITCIQRLYTKPRQFIKVKTTIVARPGNGHANIEHHEERCLWTHFGSMYPCGGKTSLRVQDFSPERKMHHDKKEIRNLTLQADSN